MSCQTNQNNPVPLQAAIFMVFYSKKTSWGLQIQFLDYGVLDHYFLYHILYNRLNLIIRFMLIKIGQILIMLSRFNIATFRNFSFLKNIDMQKRKFLLSAKLFDKNAAVKQGMYTHCLRYNFSNEQNNQNQKLTKQQAFKKKTEQMLKKQPAVEEQDLSSYSKSENNLTKYLMGVTVVALLIFYAMIEAQGVRTKKKLDTSISGATKIVAKGKASIGGDWNLIDTSGKSFGSADLQGSYYLIYFGFANCPDICPNSLVKIAKAINKIRKMPEYDYLNLRTVFVSVDPDRDTLPKLEKFIRYFDKQIIGVTAKSNEDESLKQCMKKFRIYATKTYFPGDENKQGEKQYSMDHTTVVYLMSDTNEYLAHFGGNLSEHQLAKQIIEKIVKNEYTKMQLLKHS